MRAAVYIRESSVAQGDGWSPDRQEREARQYIADKDWTLREDHLYTDLKSGRTDQRRSPVILGIRPLVERLYSTLTHEGQSTAAVGLPLGAS